MPPQAQACSSSQGSVPSRRMQLLGVYKDRVGVLALQGVKELLDRVEKLEKR